MPEQSPATLRFPVECGRLVYRTLERDLRRLAFEMDLTIQIERQMGWLDGILLVVVRGPAERLDEYLKVLLQAEALGR